jgi:DNA helicase II / ATP-dependent DNA helicase PcrA
VSSDKHLMSPAEVAARIREDFPPTSEQATAIGARLRPRVVVAGAGSGKTQTMGLRVVWLVANGLVEPHRILGLTFTRKAAAELGERIRRMLRALRAEHERSPFLNDAVAAALLAGEPTVSTYHSYASALIGEHALRVGIEPSVRLIGEALSWQYSAQVVENYAGSMDAVDRAVSTVTGDVLALAGELAEHLREPAEVRALTARARAHLASLPRAPGQRAGNVPPLAEMIATLDARLDVLPMVERYRAMKQERGTMDYGDQVAVAARIAREHREVGEIERSRFGAVLLDEYQDTGEAQRVLLTSLYAGHPVTAVGDPRQSIYGWRGASSGNLERFLDDFAGGAADQTSTAGSDRGSGASGLSVSFRNGAPILAVANQIASGIHVRGLDDRELSPGPGRDTAGRVVCALLETVVDEAAWVADGVAALGNRVEKPLLWKEIAVLARKRSHFARLEAELRARGVPCEVVGLGGLLLEPEVVDIVSTLRALADPTAGNAVVRLLAGPRWRLGPRDLDALGRRARELAPRAPWSTPSPSTPSPSTPSPSAASPSTPSADSGQLPFDEADDQPDPDYDVVDERSLIDALDNLGSPHRYSAEGYRRLTALRDELRGLRRWTGQPMPELVLAVSNALLLDVELASRPDVRPADALHSVERFIEVAEEFVASGDDPGLLAFLAYLDTAEERERGLELDRGDFADAGTERVQLMTIHAAKGLEWDAVFVAGMTAKVFPVEGQPVADWTKQLATLPFPLRGDRGELPELRWQDTTDQVGARTAIDEFRAACKARGELEERRLAYVAVTRARDLLACSGYWWDTTQRMRGPSSLLDEVRAVCESGVGQVDVWADTPADDAANPVLGVPVVRPWPFDPLGTRRAVVEDAAALVRSIDPSELEPSGAAESDSAEPGGVGSDSQVLAWREEADLLLGELARTGRRSKPIVELPSQLSVSQLVELRRDPAELARQIRRPLPRKPALTARRGTRFHLWLEQRWGQQRLLDVDELPGAADDTAEPDVDLLALQGAFQASAWWARVPTDVEFPFDIVVDGLVLRGRCDAVFTAADGTVDVVDWKTGQPKTGTEAEIASVQLAVYRLAWHYLTGVPLDRIRAAFHYVGANVTVQPDVLLDHDALVAVVRSVPARSAGGAHLADTA